MSSSESINWFTQKPGSVVCGAIAIMNARLWQGNRVESSQLAQLVKRLDISIQNDGVSGANLDRWIRQKRHFGVNRIIQPSLRKAESYLRNGDGFILRYIWEVEERRGAHYVFVCPGSRGRALVTNPHRNSSKLRYEKFRYFDHSEMKQSFSKTSIGNRHYPWIWPISRT